jgi:hypothetical protein
MIDSAAANKVFWALLLTGYPISKIPLAMKQVAFETSGYSSDLGVNHNNWSGIEKRKWEQGVSNQDVTTDRFSHFNSPYDWARAYHHILMDYHPDAYAAENINDFGNALYNSGYVKQESANDTVDNYISGMQRYSPDVDYFIKAKELIAAHIGLVIFFALVLFIWKMSKK